MLIFRVECLFLFERHFDRFSLDCFAGSHRTLEAHLREHMPESLIVDGLPKIPLAEPFQACVKPGDVVLAHYQSVLCLLCVITGFTYLLVPSFLAQDRTRDCA
jgi:hypothetical protein